jgi:hypothetical protein
MFTEKDWLMKQEQINDQLRERAQEREHRLSGRRRPPIHVDAQTGHKVLHRTLARAGRLLLAGEAR